MCFDSNFGDVDKTFSNSLRPAKNIKDIPTSRGWNGSSGLLSRLSIISLSHLMLIPNYRSVDHQINYGYI